MASTRTEIEAYAFRQLVAHLQARTDSQNIDMMNLAGFCRNCLSKWYLKGARVQGDAHMTYDEALEIVYGEPYGDWKKKHQSKATDEQMAAFEGNKHLHAKHEKDLLDPPAPRPEGAAPPPKPSPTVLSDVCCTPADECAPPGAAASAAAPGSFPGGPVAIRLGILTVSDRASSGEYADESGPAVFEAVARMAAENPRGLKLDLAATSRRVVPDDKARIASAIAEMTATGCNLVLTTGGTGCAPRDVTPEATASVLHKLAPGIVHAMTTAALAHEPHAALSRGIAGIRDRCMVVNLPGRPRAAADNASALAPVLVHALRQVSGD